MHVYNEETIIRQLQDPATMREAFAQVVAHYSEPLYWQIRKMVVSHDDTDDLLQNTFMKAWANIDYFRGDAKLSTWLYRIAVNESITFLNKERANPCLPTNGSTVTNGSCFYSRRLPGCPKNNGWFSPCAISMR